MIDISAIAMAAVNVTSGSAPSSNSEFPWSRHQGHIDSQLWRQYRQHCGVRRFWNGEVEQVGRLVHKPGGADHARWGFSITTPPGPMTTKPGTVSACAMTPANNTLFAS